MEEQTGFAIIIPVKEINNYIRDSIPRTLELDYPNFEIIILPNEAPNHLEDFLQDSRVKIIPTGKVSPAVKRDIGAENTNLKWLAFLDDDAYPRKDWLKVAEEIFAKTGVQGLGGPGITPPSNDLRQQASGLFFESLVGGGGMDYRYRPGRRDLFLVDDYPTVNLIVERKAFFDAGGFDSHYWPGEDTKFCLDFTKAGHKIMYSRDLIVWHHRRQVLQGHLKQVGNYGLHRGYFAKKFPQTSARLVYFVPSAFFLWNILMLLDLFTLQIATNLLIGVLGLYFAITAVDIFTRTKRLGLGFLTVGTVYISHLTYGFMFLKGLLGHKKLESQLR